MKRTIPRFTRVPSFVFKPEVAPRTSRYPADRVTDNVAAMLPRIRAAKARNLAKPGRPATHFTEAD